MLNSSYPTGRFAPTPSGKMHLGNVASALIAWASIRSASGKILLRIEDIDPRGASKENARLLLKDLAWLGLDFDEGPLWQSERISHYENALAKLEELDLVYPCFCTRADLHVASAPHASDGTPLYPGTCRNLTSNEIAAKLSRKKPALRLQVPEVSDPASTISFTDKVFGPQRQNLATSSGDFVLRRSDDVFAYQLAVSVDDCEMGITEVVRGHDLLSSTSRQLYLAKLLRYKAPSYAHIPMLVNSEGKRLSKRDQDLDIASLRAAGVAAEEIIGVIANAYGFIENAKAISAKDFAEHFSWNVLKKCVDENRSNIVVDTTFFNNIAC